MPAQEQTEPASIVPDKRYFTIGEVGRLCGVKPHVLRYWEQEFEQLQPVKRRGNRRYYQRQDVLLVRQLCELLYERGYTIAGARQWLAGGQSESDEHKYRQLLRQMVSELDDLLQELKKG